MKKLGSTFNGAIDLVVEKNRKFSKITQIKKLIKKESNSIIKAYITLGKHYYAELRDVPNYDMQKVCSQIEESNKEIKRLKKKLEEIKNEINLSDFAEMIAYDEPTESGATSFDKVVSNITSETDKVLEDTEV